MQDAGRGKLILCPTPLGNLGDVSRRVLEALEAVDVVCAEDTRVTAKLLAALGVSKRLERLDEQRMGALAPRYVQRVLAGETIAYCSDAGMPGISDPGQRLVRAARAAGAPVEVLPGPTAFATAYVASGCESTRFYFGGFFPRKAAERVQTLRQLAGLDAALIFYESPFRVPEALACIAGELPKRQVAVCRELTKLHEEVFVARADEAAREFAERAQNGTVKGEFVLVIDGPAAEEEQEGYRCGIEQARVLAGELLEQGLFTKQVAKRLRAECGISRNHAYALAMDPNAELQDDDQA